MIHIYAAVKTGYSTISDFSVHVCEWNPRLVKVLLAFIWQLQNRFQLMISWKLPQIFRVAKKIAAWITDSSILSNFQRILTYIGFISTLWACLSFFLSWTCTSKAAAFFKNAEKQNKKKSNPHFFSQKWLTHSDLVILLSFHSIGTFKFFVVVVQR